MREACNFKPDPMRLKRVPIVLSDGKEAFGRFPMRFQCGPRRMIGYCVKNGIEVGQLALASENSDSKSR